MIRTLTLVMALSFLSVALRAQGPEKAAEPVAAAAPQGYQPLSRGTRWTYAAGAGQLVIEVVGEQEVGSVRCAVCRFSGLGPDKLQALAWTPKGLLVMADQGPEGLRALETPRCAIQLPLASGATWTGTLEGAPIRYELKTGLTLEIGETKVPCILVTSRRSLPDGSTEEVERYYALGIGCVRQVMHRGQQEMAIMLQRADFRGPREDEAEVAEEKPAPAPQVEEVEQKPAPRQDAAAFERGVAAYQRGDFGTALETFAPLAEAGNLEACFLMGLMHQHGRGTAQDPAAAAGWYARAAARGHGPSQNNLGVLTREGWGVPQDFQKARQLFEAAAFQGNDDAQLSLGALCANGQGMPRNLVAAFAWYTLSADAGNPQAAHNLGLCIDAMSPQEIEAAERLAENLLARVRASR